jgi:hypothetical protein
MSDNVKEIPKSLQDSLDQASDRTSQVNILTEHILHQLSATDPVKAKSTKLILQKYNKLQASYPSIVPKIPDNTYTVLLSRVSNDKNSRINCPGKKQGYYLDQIVKEIEEIDEKPTPSMESEDKDIVLEKELYPYVKEWLFEKNHERVADISNLKRNGKWGNPDLIGLNIEEIYGRPEVEVTTIEVKITDEGWEKWIFEAIAHTRFSNRSYFAFIYPENLINKLDSTGLNLYAEHFKIGVLIIAVNNDDYLKIKKKQSVNLDQESISIIEYIHAPFHETHIKFRKRFFESLNILELTKLYNFGETLD